jgi:hypothetical protein
MRAWLLIIEALLAMDGLTQKSTPCVPQSA